MRESRKLKKKIKTLFFGLLIVLLVLNYFSFSSPVLDFSIELAISILLALIFSYVIAIVLEKMGFKKLSKMAWRKKVFGFNVSISAFFIITILLKIYLF